MELLPPPCAAPTETIDQPHHEAQLLPMRIADLMLLIEDIIFQRVVFAFPAGGPQRITRLPTNRAACKNWSTGCRLERVRMDVIRH